MADRLRDAPATDGLAWLGLVPSEYSSGLRKRQGAISKCGNGFARRLLIEAAWAYRYPPKVSPSIQKRHEGISRLIVDRALSRNCACANAFSRSIKLHFCLTAEVISTPTLSRAAR